MQRELPSCRPWALSHKALPVLLCPNHVCFSGVSLGSVWSTEQVDRISQGRRSPSSGLPSAHPWPPRLGTRGGPQGPLTEGLSTQAPRPHLARTPTPPPGDGGAVLSGALLAEPFPCGKRTLGRSRRSADHGSEAAPEAGRSEQEPGDLGPTEGPLHLLSLNDTEPGPEEDEDESSLVRIVGGRDCREGECPWQVPAGREPLRRKGPGGVRRGLRGSPAGAEGPGGEWRPHPRGRATFHFGCGRFLPQHLGPTEADGTLGKGVPCCF